MWSEDGCRWSWRRKRGSGLGAYEKLHLGDFLVHLLHKLNYKVNQLVLQHFLGVEVGDEEGYVVSLDGTG
jgi:hypothetical protein